MAISGAVLRTYSILPDGTSSVGYSAEDAGHSCSVSANTRLMVSRQSGRPVSDRAIRKTSLYRAQESASALFRVSRSNFQPFPQSIRKAAPRW